ncbi:MAG: energy transducer TonB [Myxococcales bacterium]|nr:energy transducer TonB [Myxococcales bacterium]
MQRIGIAGVAGWIACGWIACAPAARPSRWGDVSAAIWPEVDNATLEARLTSPPAPFPSDATRTRIARAGGGAHDVALRLCVAASGATALVEVIAASGDDGYDADAVDALRGWQFAPGADQCTIITIRYAQR